MHGTDAGWHLRHISADIACFWWQCGKGSMDDAESRGYHFDNARMTESCGVALGPSPLPVPWVEEGTKLRFVRSHDLRSWARLAATALCFALPGATVALAGSVAATATLEERKLPMRFSWVA